MVEQVRERDAGNGDGQVVHVGKVGLAEPARLMDLLKDDLTGGASLGAPEGNVALEGAQLDELIAARVQQAELVEERLDLQGRSRSSWAWTHGQSCSNGLGRVRPRGCLSWLGSWARRSYLRAVRTLMPARAAAC